MKLCRKSRGHTEVHTGALNDILFILLLFFLIVSTLANPNVIKLAQPKADGDTQSKQTVVVSIDAKGQLYVGQKPIANEIDLSGALEHFIKGSRRNPASKNPVVVINADKAVAIEKVVRVMNLAKKLGAKSVLSVKKP